MVGGSFHHLFKLNVRLSSGKNFTHLDDVVLQEVFVQGERNMQPADKREGNNFLPTVGDFGEFVLEEADV